MVVNEKCIFPWEFKGSNYNGCVKARADYFWCSHKPVFGKSISVDVPIEGVHWSKCYEEKGVNTAAHWSSQAGQPHVSKCFGEPTCNVGIQTAKDWVIQNDKQAFSELNTRERLKKIPEWKCSNKERFQKVPPLSQVRLELNLTFTGERRPIKIYNPILWQTSKSMENFGESCIADKNYNKIKEEIDFASGTVNKCTVDTEKVACDWDTL